MVRRRLQRQRSGYLHPGDHEKSHDNDVDENCDGVKAVNLDRDGDGNPRAPPTATTRTPSIHVGAVDKSPRNGIDENCDGKDAVDLDRRPRRLQPAAGLQRRQNRAINPGAKDAPGNAIDEDCDGRPPWPRAKVGVTLKSETLKSGVTRLLALRLTGLRARDTLQVLCRSRGCRGRIDYRGRMHRNHARLNLSRVVRNRRLQPGVRLRVRVGRRNRAASVVTFTTRRRPGKRPLRELRCQWPQERALRPC